MTLLREEVQISDTIERRGVILWKVKEEKIIDALEMRGVGDGSHYGLDKYNSFWSESKFGQLFGNSENWICLNLRMTIEKQ